jgi:hypothetical protein
MCGRGEADVNPMADAWGGNLVGQGLQMEGLIDGRGTVDAGFDPSGSRSRAGSPVGRVLGAYLRHAPVGVHMKPLVTASEKSNHIPRPR